MHLQMQSMFQGQMGAGPKHWRGAFPDSLVTAEPMQADDAQITEAKNVGQSQTGSDSEVLHAPHTAWVMDTSKANRSLVQVTA